MALSMSTSELRKGSDFVEEDLILCQPCSVDNKNIKATSFCSDCDSYLCQKCSAYHAALNSTKNHVLVNPDQAKKAAPVVTKDKCTKKCTIHKGKTVKYYCEEHSHFGCSICITGELKACRTVEHIPSEAAKVKSHNAFKSFDANLGNLQKAYTIGLADLKKNIHQCQTDEKGLKNILTQFKKEVIDALEKFETDTLAEAKQLYTAETMKLDTLSRKLEKQQGDVEALVKEVGELLSRRQNCDVYVLAQTGGARLAALQQELTNATRDMTYLRYTLHTNTDVLKVGALGKLATRQEAVISSNTVILVTQSGPAVKHSAPVAQPSGYTNKPSSQAVKPRVQASKPRDGRTMEERLAPGTRVRRGPNWCYLDQDGGAGGLGTVTGPWKGVPGWYWVKSDATGVTMAISVQTDGGAGGLGTVTGPREGAPGRYWVKWDATGETWPYMMKDGCYPLEIVC